jgi:hypothetical protein
MLQSIAAFFGGIVVFVSGLFGINQDVPLAYSGSQAASAAAAEMVALPNMAFLAAAPPQPLVAGDREVLGCGCVRCLRGRRIDGGVSEDILNAKLQEFANALRSEFYGPLSSITSTPA